MDTGEVFDRQLTAFIFIGLGEKQRTGKIATYPKIGAAEDTYGVVDMGTEGLSTRIAIELGRIYLEWQCCRDKQRVST